MSPATEHNLTEPMRDELASYALGLLPPEDAARVSQHLQAGCHQCNQEVSAIVDVGAQLAAAFPQQAPAPDVKQRLLARVRNEKLPGSDSAPGIYVVRSGSGVWKNTPWAGITYQRLYHDKATGAATSLLRVEPGARYPAHRHRGVEQSWIVEGSCRIGSIVIRAGDFACATAGSEHDVLESDEGCLLLIVSSAKDELLA